MSAPRARLRQQPYEGVRKSCSTFVREVVEAYRCAIQRTNETVSLSIFSRRYRGFGLEDGIDTSH